MAEMETVTLFRPVGITELELIRASGRFPPRLPFQPIFYPVLNFEYAAFIAREWNTKDAASGFRGFVTEFDVSKSFLDRYEVQTVGSAHHQEYWVPSEELDEFNANIVGEVRVTAEW